MGFNYSPNNPVGSENHADTRGERRKDSDCDALDHVFRIEATRHATKLENWAYTKNTGRCHLEYVPNALKLSNNVDEINNSSRVTSGPTSSPNCVPEIPWPCQPFGTRVSESTFSGKMKLLCSFGGRIMPRPNDGKLRYVGGETRIISIRNNVTWKELAKKTLVICDQSHTIKYQLPDEDLKALISVSSDEDLPHMIEEYQRLMEARKDCCNADCQYVVAVNGMLEHSPQKSSNGQSSASHLGTASNYKIPSPPASPVNIQYRDHKNSKNLFYVDQPFPYNNKNIGTFAVEKLLFDAAYYNNLPHGPIPLVNQACYRQYPGETDQTTKQLEIHLLNHSQSGDFLSCQLSPQNSMNSDWPAIMERAFFDSQLKENGEVAEKWLEEAVIPLSFSIDGREKSPALEMSNSSLDRPVPAPIIMDEKHQLIKFENHCGGEMSYMDLDQEVLKWMNWNANYSDVDRQQCEGNVEVALNDNAMEHLANCGGMLLVPNASSSCFHTNLHFSEKEMIKNSDVEEVQELGSGTFGTVYYGKWRGTDRRDFWREARILSDLHHPNVLAFYGVVPDGPGGTMATVTEYMVNGSLRRVLQKKDRSLDRRKKLMIVLDTAFGMEYLYLRDIIHFDLKCDNLLVNLRDPNAPYVGDFGLSKIKRNTLVSGGVHGTLPWMAPELLDGNNNRVSEKVDVFSFGIVIWEILTGEEPYANMQFGAIIGGIVSNTLRPPLPEHCDSGWRTLMEECWASHPKARPSFTEITDRLRNMSATLQPKQPNFANR
ncbi:hypothetical protein SADUNF_Sadunf03G0136200 [Salix dunnii]|uniref:Protein kinase domain-containing protein n=1 Tax=Salix dunnii TaxID=1413687 RepID=A0A835TGK5_9ROSI|nr:hypothetical protein SADUNF_Sadunf03G0136200 [Salix dunnii]